MLRIVGIPHAFLLSTGGLRTVMRERWAVEHVQRLRVAASDSMTARASPLQFGCGQRCAASPTGLGFLFDTQARSSVRVVAFAQFAYFIEIAAAATSVKPRRSSTKRA